MLKKFIVVLLLTLSFSSLSQAKPESKLSDSCTSCHQSSHDAWQQSDHAKAMAIADKSSVVADFTLPPVSHYSQQAHFYLKDQQYMAKVTIDDKSETFQIKYTFGHYPLQQYLVETEPGRLQVLPFAWDARSVAEGGQRWYHNYSNEEITAADRLHWRQPLQNWNGMCADCHSDGLVRNYDPEKNRFDSQWDGINVGCLSCHGEMSQHANTATKVPKSSTKPDGQWLRTLGQKTAQWQGLPRDNRLMDNCYACHALRAPLTDGFTANQPFLDQFTPQLLAAPMYHADGQIKEEVYVFGSFQQSKMFAAGVNCLDCHDKHTMKLKLAGNALCLQCHSNQDYDVKQHHQHQENSSGAQCANCHMPQNRYMGVDDRRDHSFKIPRPDLSIKYGIPNACIKCHDQQDDQWALQAVTKWHGPTKPLPSNLENYYLLHSGQQISLTAHLAIIADEQLAVIIRATALQLLSYSTNQLTVAQLADYLTDQEPLLRLAAADSALLLPIEQRVKALSPLLNDSLKAIRVAAARSLIDARLSGQDAVVFRQALSELQSSNELSSWRGEGRLNNGMIEARTNQPKAAEQSFKSALKIDPYFEAGYINLADYYRSQQRAVQVMSVLTRGISKLPKSASLRYSYGLYLIRQQQRDKASTVFERAMLLDPSNPQYAYTYILALDGIGQTTIALSKLQQLFNQYQANQQLKELGLYLARKENNRASYQWFMAR